jgi:hypothetical protein
MLKTNRKLNEINEIITLCDEMIDYICEYGIIRTGNQLYESYMRRIYAFFSARKGLQHDYGPYYVLRTFYYANKDYTLCLSEAKAIRDAVIGMKHELFPNCYEKVFISHREKDKDQVAAFIELLYALGIQRPKRDDTENAIFCTSHPAAYIENGKQNLDEIKRHFNDHAHILYILWYTDSYFESQACMNEAGAIWAMNKRYQEILSPSLNSSRIGGLLDKQPVWFRSNDKYRLNIFKEQIEEMFDLPQLTTNAWEVARDTFISRIEAIN